MKYRLVRDYHILGMGAIDPKSEDIVESDDIEIIKYVMKKEKEKDKETKRIGCDYRIYEKTEIKRIVWSEYLGE